MGKEKLDIVNAVNPSPQHWRCPKCNKLLAVRKDQQFVIKCTRTDCGELVRLTSSHECDTVEKVKPQA